MGRITEVFYKELPLRTIRPKEAGQFYFYHNLMEQTELFQEAYEKNEAEQLQLRNQVIGKAIERGEIERGRVNMTGSFMGISSLKNRVVAVVELR